MTPAEVSSAVAGAVQAAVAAGELAAGVAGEVPVSCVDAGVYRTPVAMRLGVGVEGAAVVAKRVAEVPGVAEVRVTGPGFLTIRVAEPGALAVGIVAAGREDRQVDGARSWADRPRTFENPGFSVRYAYARAAAVHRRAADFGVGLGDPGQLADFRELRLLRCLGELPGRSAQAVRERDAEPLKQQLVRVADAFHEVYERCPALPVGDEKPGAVHGARLTLAEATRIALANGLHMIGEEARERI